MVWAPEPAPDPDPGFTGVTTFYETIIFQQFKKLSPVFTCFLLCCCLIQDAKASTPSEAVTELKIADADTFVEIETATEFLRKSSTDAIKENSFTYSLQKAILSKSGECISKLRVLQEKEGDENRGKAKDLFMKNRDVINNILELNKKVITEFREQHLDQMKDPFTFFASSEWQHPQHLISLASYWIGWNSYYSSLLFPKTDPFRIELLEQAIEGFSRAFIDFQEDEIIAKSLFGRAICYRQIKEYRKAMHDFKLVKDKIQRNDPLYLRCEYEEALVSYETGNFNYALRKIDGIHEAVLADTIPDDIGIGLNKLRAKVLLGILEKDGKRGKPDIKETDNEFLRTFNELKNLASGDKGIKDQLYRYVQEHPGSFEHLPYVELGPIGTAAIGDWFFSKNHFDKALFYYLRINSSPHSIPGDLFESVWFRTAFIYCQKNQWQDALPFLENLIKQYPKSSLIGQASHLYYVAASNIYTENSSKSNYARFIKSTKSYLERCGTYPDQSEAHFQLGKFYQAEGKIEAAQREYRQVGVDSPNYSLAKYHILQFNVNELESLDKNGANQSERAVDLHRESVSLLSQYHELKIGNNDAVNLKTIEPHMIILETKLHLYGPENDRKKSLKALDGFETRFSLERKLCTIVTGLRIECYHKLRLHDKIEKEIDRLINAHTVDAQRYFLLFNLANRFYDEAKALWAKEEKTLASHPATTALLIYRKLGPISVSNPQHYQDAELAQIRMAEIYINEDQLAHATKLLQDILKNNPQSANAVYNLACIHERKEQWGKALIAWRRFSDGVKAGTYHWLESRYRTPNALNKLGQTDKACAVITMTIVLHPDLGGHQLKTKFLGLKSKICD